MRFPWQKKYRPFGFVEGVDPSRLPDGVVGIPAEYAFEKIESLEPLRAIVLNALTDAGHDNYNEVILSSALCYVSHLLKVNEREPMYFAELVETHNRLLTVFASVCKSNERHELRKAGLL